MLNDIYRQNETLPQKLTTTVRFIQRESSGVSTGTFLKVLIVKKIIQYVVVFNKEALLTS